MHCLMSGGPIGQRQGSTHVALLRHAALSWAVRCGVMLCCAVRCCPVVWGVCMPDWCRAARPGAVGQARLRATRLCCCPQLTVTSLGDCTVAAQQRSSLHPTPPLQMRSAYDEAAAGEGW